MPETWTHPPVLAREAPAAWRAVWRFRIAALLLLAVMVLLAILLIRYLTGATAQDPDVNASAPRPPALAHAG
ncbi:MAG TPA: hypothetical protein VNA30_05295 [Mycobacteriales bacterium]|nr:hypothetical protein [Mycobacteriales bacterium]